METEEVEKRCSDLLLRSPASRILLRLTKHCVAGVTNSGWLTLPQSLKSFLLLGGYCSYYIRCWTCAKHTSIACTNTSGHFSPLEWRAKETILVFFLSEILFKKLIDQGSPTILSLQETLTQYGGTRSRWLLPEATLDSKWLPQLTSSPTVKILALW